MKNKDENFWETGSLWNLALQDENILKIKNLRQVIEYFLNANFLILHSS